MHIKCSLSYADHPPTPQREMLSVVFLVLCRSSNYLARRAAVCIKWSLSSRSLSNSASKVTMCIKCSLSYIDHQASQQGEMLCV